MPTYSKIVHYSVRPVIDRSDIRFDGLTGEEEDYGCVQIVRVTTHERRATGDVARLLDSHKIEDVVIERLTADEAAALVAGLSRSLVHSLRVQEGR